MKLLKQHFQHHLSNQKQKNSLKIDKVRVWLLCSCCSCEQKKKKITQEINLDHYFFKLGSYRFL